MYRKRMNHREMKALVLKVVADCRGLAEDHIRNWQPFDRTWQTIEGAVYLRLSDDTQVAVERGSLEQQIHIAISEAQYRSEQEKVNYRITEFYIEPGITGTHGNRPEFIRLQYNISCKNHSFVIFKEISRLVRDIEIWKRFFRLCQSHDCEICLRGLPFNPNDPASILQLDQLAAFAEFESRTISKRVKESVHSAMLTAGKFNGYFPLLGFDALKSEHGDYTGIYTPNEEELKQVELLMQQFLRVDRYSLLLNWCSKMNIKTKRGEDFTRFSIKTLLTNPRYIGKWYRNKHNAGKRQNKLMPYERYTEVELGHGCVIDAGLWQRVQDKVKELDGSRTQATIHCYPLSGLLVFTDGSSFTGSGSRTGGSPKTYYYNKANNIRIRTEIFESEAEKTLQHVASKSVKLQQSIADYANQKDAAIGVVAKKIAEIDTNLAEVVAKRESIDKRLSFLLEGNNLEMAQSFRDEYGKQFMILRDKERELGSTKKQLQLMHKHLSEAQSPRKDGGLERINEAINYIKKDDLTSLKSVYRRMFQKIVIRPLEDKKVQLEFIFKDMTTPPSGGVVTYCTAVGKLPLPIPHPCFVSVF